MADHNFRTFPAPRQPVNGVTSGCGYVNHLCDFALQVPLQFVSDVGFGYAGRGKQVFVDLDGIDNYTFIRACICCFI